MATATAPIHAVIDGIPAVLPVLSVELPDGRTGYYERSPTECLKAPVPQLLIERSASA